MAAPPISERHKPHFHRQAPALESVRVATTASITIATALNVGDSLDGITLADGDRVLVKDQGTASGNGIYVAGASPARAYDQSTDDPGWGFLVYVREGTAGGGKIFRNTNTSVPTIGSTSITFTELSGSGSPTGAAGGDLSGTYPNPSVTDDSHAHTASTLTGVIETGDAAGGDLSGTYPNPSVVDDSHSHTAATLPPLGGSGHILMEDGTSSPPLPLWTEDGTDYLYSD